MEEILTTYYPRYNVQPKAATFNTLIYICTKNKDPQRALDYYISMLSLAIRPNERTYVNLLDTLSEHKNFTNYFHDVYDRMLKENSENNSEIFLTLKMRCLMVEGKLEEALVYFDKVMEVRNFLESYGKGRKRLGKVVGIFF